MVACWLYAGVGDTPALVIIIEPPRTTGTVAATANTSGRIIYSGLAPRLPSTFMSTANSPDAPALNEMLRIMDVATAARRQSELIEQQFDVTKAREVLREKLLSSSSVTGEQLTPEQVDAAIEWYYRNLYAFREPPPSWSLTFAHLYVDRWRWL